MKCIIFVRCSTERQEVQSQLDQTIEYAKSLHYDEFKIIKRVGASAYKVSKLYLEMLDEMYHTIETDKDIKAVVCWHLNRLARNDEVAMQIKSFLVRHKVQLHIKEPSIKLFRDDGSVDDGAELAFSLFATMSRQQTEELRKKSSRAKTRDKALHKYIGGPVVRWGYKVNPITKMVEPDPEKAEIVKEIYDIYINTHHSYPKATREINERRGLNLGQYVIEGILQSPKYYDQENYPPIIDEKTYREAEKIRNHNNNGKDIQNKNRRFANRIFKCPICGQGYTANVRDYRHTCKCNVPNIAISKLDGLLWLIASHLESERLLHSNNKEEFLQKKVVLASKIESVGNYTAKGEKKAERAKKMALEGYIEIDEYKAILKEIETSEEETRKKVEGWRAQIQELDNLIKEDKLSIEKILKVSGQITSSDEKAMRDIVRKWIVSVVMEDYVLTINTLTKTYKCKYLPYFRLQPWFTVNGGQILIQHVLRDKFGGCKLKDIKPVYLKDLPTTIAWLNNSEIV